VSAYYLFKERRKYAYAFISVYYLGLIVATVAALYSVAKTDGVNQFVISTSFYLNHISRTYLFAYWFLFFTTFFTICSIVIVILSSNLLLDQWNRERAFSSMRNSDLVKEFCGWARTYWQYYGSQEKKEMELGAKALLEARWDQYELNRRNIRHTGLFEACRFSDAAVRDTEESKVLKSLEGRPEWEDVSVEQRTLAKLSAIWRSFWRDNTD
jgi:hypothetical protein